MVRPPASIWRIMRWLAARLSAPSSPRARGGTANTQRSVSSKRGAVVLISVPPLWTRRAVRSTLACERIEIEQPPCPPHHEEPPQGGVSNGDFAQDEVRC